MKQKEFTDSAKDFYARINDNGTLLRYRNMLCAIDRILASNEVVRCKIEFNKTNSFAFIIEGNEGFYRAFTFEDPEMYLILKKYVN